MQTRLPTEHRQAEIVAAALQLASASSPALITTGDIAEAIGVTQGAVFKHFPSKDAIVQAVIEWVSERLLARVDAAAARAASPLGALEAMFMAHIAFVAEHPGVPRMIFGELQRDRASIPKQMVQTLIRRYRERLKRILVDGIACGELDAAIDTDAAAVLFVGTIQGLVMQSLLSGNPATMRRDAARVFAIYRRGIRSDPS